MNRLPFKRIFQIGAASTAIGFTTYVSYPKIRPLIPQFSPIKQIKLQEINRFDNLNKPNERRFVEEYLSLNPKNIYTLPKYHLTDDLISWYINRYRYDRRVQWSDILRIKPGLKQESELIAFLNSYPELIDLVPNAYINQNVYDSTKEALKVYIKNGPSYSRLSSYPKIYQSEEMIQVAGKKDYTLISNIQITGKQFNELFNHKADDLLLDYCDEDNLFVLDIRKHRHRSMAKNNDEIVVKIPDDARVKFIGYMGEHESGEVYIRYRVETDKITKTN